MHQCKSIGNSRIQIFLVLTADKLISFPWLSLCCTTPVRTGKRFCGIAPPGIKALVKKSFLCLFPVHFSRFFIKSIISRIIIKKMTSLKKLCMVLAACIHIRPYGNHGMGIQFVDFLRTFFHISVTLLIQDLLAPVSRIPGIPVLYHTVKRNPDLTVVTNDLKKLFCRVILLFGLYIAISPFRQHLRLACKITVIMDDLIHSMTAHKIIIDLIYSIQKQIGIFQIIIKSHK